MICLTAEVVDPAKTSRAGSEPNRTSRTVSEPSRRSLHRAVEGHLRYCPCAHRGAGGIPVDCLKCKNLEQAFESGLSKYIEARSAAYYRVSTELAAHMNVDMERARNNMEEHQLACVSAAEVRRRDQ
jgi:hypothetical protein